MRRSLSLIALVSLGGLLYATPCYGQARRSLETIFELHAADDLTIPPRTIIESCSPLLASRDKHNPQRVAKALVSRGDAYLQLGDCATAKKDFDDLCKLRPRDVQARCLRSAALAGLGQLDAAFEDAKEAIRLDPLDPMAYMASASCLHRQGDRRASLQCLDKVLSLDAKWPSAYFLRGLIYFRSDPAKCLESMNRFLELAPYSGLDDPSVPYYYRGFSLLLLHRPKEALTNHLMARKLNPTSFDTARELALTYAELEKYNLASHYAEECIRLDRANYVGYGLAAKYYAKAGRSKEAAEAMKKLLLLSTKNPDFIFLGEVQVENGRYSEGLESYNKALAARPGRFLALLGKASLLATCPDAKIRDGAQAVKLAKEALTGQKVPDGQKWQPTMVLAEAYAECGNFDDAVRLARQALEMVGPDSGRRREFQEKLALFEKKLPYQAKTPTQPLDK